MAMYDLGQIGKINNKKVTATYDESANSMSFYVVGLKGGKKIKIDGIVKNNIILADGTVMQPKDNEDTKALFEYIQSHDPELIVNDDRVSWLLNACLNSFTNANYRLFAEIKSIEWIKNMRTKENEEPQVGKNGAYLYKITFKSDDIRKRYTPFLTVKVDYSFNDPTVFVYPIPYIVMDAVKEFGSLINDLISDEINVQSGIER